MTEERVRTFLQQCRLLSFVILAPASKPNQTNSSYKPARHTLLPSPEAARSARGQTCHLDFISPALETRSLAGSSLVPSTFPLASLECSLKLLLSFADTC